MSHETTTLDKHNAGIDSFWAYWNKHKPEISQAIEDGVFQEWYDRLDSKINSIHHGMLWELAPGFESKNMFCFVFAGDMERRVIAERCILKAPAACEQFEYYSSKQATYAPGMTIVNFGIDLEYDEYLISIALDVDRSEADLCVYHPAFKNFSDDVRAFFTFACLDVVLGEDDVERWISEVTYGNIPYGNSVPVSKLRDVLSPIMLPVEHNFALLELSARDMPDMIATIDVAVKPIDHILLDNLLTIKIPLPSSSDGMADVEFMDFLYSAEDVLTESIGEYGIFVGHETGGGFMAIFYHVNLLGPVNKIVDAWLVDCSHLEPSHHFTHDPKWEILERWS